MKTLRVASPVADIHGAPDDTVLRGKFETQLVFGEEFTVETEENGWCKGVCAHDGYKGYIRKELLAPAATPTHIVTEARSHLYREPTIKSPLVRTLSFGSLVRVAKEGDKFMQLDDGAWIYKPHLAPIGSKEEDHIATAKKFLETPYYWGGRSGFGIDCSGLVQVALARAGIKAPRDTEEQQNSVGSPIDSPRTGDIVFFKGHVGIMTDADTLLHANAHHMKVCLEPLWAVDARAGGITMIRRI